MVYLPWLQVLSVLASSASQLCQPMLSLPLPSEDFERVGALVSLFKIAHSKPYLSQGWLNSRRA